ncbi:TolB-like translocation protein [Streptoalloteichus hindustanus]|uniref:WD40-like Beta Propeller Repeat n=1 Tax=Streptoalloteichus hindustanus TaxID=2017 RepID=A0A1M5EUE9_STRHI|nr:PD40 domain-containing protein [Streptoalloteichus hindustanus]SHF82701.1 WD40-like Beta Propeller Repeat [Streptoalloteichus hindustanus]
MTALSHRARLLVAALAAVALTGVAVVSVRMAAGAGGTDATPPTQANLAEGPRLQVLTNGQLSVVSAQDPGGPRTVTAVRCDRAHAAAHVVVCLRPVEALRTTQLVVLDRDLREQRSVDLAGIPNRARVSPSGRLVAWTLFVDGHSYATGGFSTQTGILDTRSGQIVKSLEEFTVARDGQPYRAEDVNFWGVTFADDDNRFYATMSTNGHRYLVEGDLAARTVRTLADNVECPSLSPDGTRVAFKAAVDGDPGRGWRLSTLDLASLRATALSETRSVDDQPAWLDNTTLAYALQREDGTNDVWSVPADGAAMPRLLVPGANSPVFLSEA